jgi:hypothetical protein
MALVPRHPHARQSVLCILELVLDPFWALYLREQLQEQDMCGQVELSVRLLNQEVFYDLILRVLWREDLKVHDFV